MFGNFLKKKGSDFGFWVAICNRSFIHSFSILKDKYEHSWKVVKRSYELV